MFSGPTKQKKVEKDDNLSVTTSRVYTDKYPLNLSSTACNYDEALLPYPLQTDAVWGIRRAPGLSSIKQN